MFAAAVAAIFLLFSSVSTAKPAAFPGHSYVLACGASFEASDTNGRTWSPDSKSAVISGESSAATADHQDPSLPSQVPYMTARVFTSSAAGLNFTFSNLPPNRRLWVRLHFYPSSYLGLDPATSFLSAFAAHVTLLRNFSAAAAALAHTQAYIVKEFSILPRHDANNTNSEDRIFRLSLTHTGSHGFVNGIEVIPAPEISSFSSSAGDGEDLQTMYRLNVGGQYLPAARDPRLSRTWYDDTPYLLGVFSGVTIEAENGRKGDHRPRYGGREPPECSAAPRTIYRTARSAGSETDANENLTWVFEVDAGFNYFIRLHFCEIVRQVVVGERVFDVLIDNRTVGESIDVIKWARGAGIPVFKDFSIRVESNRSEAESGLSVTLRSSPESLSRRGPSLNGIEILKLGGDDGNLAGLNPTPSKMRLAAAAKRSKRHYPTREIKGIAGGVASGAAGCAVVMTALFFAVHRHKRRKSSPGTGSDWPLPFRFSVVPTRSISGLSSFSIASSSFSRFSTLGPNCRHFSLAEIRKGSDGFSESRVIGVGGFGKVYRGKLDINGSSTPVAMKRSNPNSGQGVIEFQTEIETLSKLRHKHLVSLVGFCMEASEMILVYEYMANGTLREHLSTHPLEPDQDPRPSPPAPPLPWPKRVEICVGAARGLHYLHAGTNGAIIHRDVKSTNILLDENWVAKVSDFGLSKQGASSVDQTHVSTMVKGSFGYLDPEYFRRQKLTDKSDVYSFGVVLFEVLCARPALIPNLSREQCSLADWVMFSKSKGTFNQIIDPSLKDVIGSESFEKFVETAERCLADQGVDRPSMGEVLWNLEFALQLFENPEFTNSPGEKRINVINYSPSSSQTDSTGSGSTADGLNSAVVFSQLVNPRGR